MRSILVDFYNLHLSELPSEKEKILGNLVSLKYTTNELRRIWWFLQAHTPLNIREITKKEKEKAPQFLEGVSIDLSNIRKNVETKELPLVRKDYLTYENEEIYALLNKIAIHNYSEFGELYHHIKKLIDEFLDGYIAVDSLEWLERRKKDYSIGRAIVKKDYSELYPIESLSKMGKERISRDEYIIAWLPPHYRSQVTMDEMRLALSNSFHQIYDDTISALQGRLTIQRCEAGKTPKMEACQNIFIPQRKSAKYCSDSCRMRIYQSKRRADLKRQDEESLAQARASLREYRKRL
jgi:hypothetical protein